MDYVAIGKRIRTRRKKLNLTQEQLAEKCGFSLSHVSNVETGHTKLSLPAIVTIANALDTTVDRLLCDNLINSQHLILEELQILLSDCDHKDLRVIESIVRAAKDSLKTYHET